MTRKTGSPVATGELVTRHALESFLDRLVRTRHGNDFVLKGGILLACYGVRRPTKDVDSEAWVSSSYLAPPVLMNVGPNPLAEGFQWVRRVVVLLVRRR